MPSHIKYSAILAVSILICTLASPCFAIREAISELRERLENAENTEEVIVIAEKTIQQGEQAIEELKGEVQRLKDEKAELEKIQTALTSGLIGAVVTAVVAVIGFIFKAMSSKVDRDLKRLEVAEKLFALESEGVSIPGDIRQKYGA